MSGIATVYAVFADHAEAERIGREMIAARHAACVNILAPCRSIFHWQDRLEESEEVPALFKVAADSAEALVHEIAARHSYDVPAIAIWPIAGTTEAYAAWVASPLAHE